MKNNLKKIAIISMSVICFIGIFLLGIGIYKRVGINNKYSEENVQKEFAKVNEELIDARKKLDEKLESLKQEIQPIKQTINEKMREKIKTKPNSEEFNNYTKEINELSESINSKQEEIKLIENYTISKLCLDSDITKEVCDLENKIDNYDEILLNENMNKELNSNRLYIIYGVIIIVVGIIIGGSLIIYDSKRNK